MASRKTTTKKRNVTKKTTNTKTAKKTTNVKTEEQQRVQDEIIIWISLAVCILLIISNFGIGGFIGKFFRNIMFRFMGVFAYLFPVLLFGQISFIISNKKNVMAYIKILATVILALDICSFITLLSRDGGKIGSAICGSLKPALGIAGSYIVVVFIAIICMVVISQKAFLHGMHKRSSEAAKVHREAVAQRRKEALALKEEEKKEQQKEQQGNAKSSATRREAKRQEHQIRGVSFDTTLAEEPTKGRKKKTGGMVELKAKPDIPDPFEVEKPMEPKAATAQKEPVAAQKISDIPIFSSSNVSAEEPADEAGDVKETKDTKKTESKSGKKLGAKALAAEEEAVAAQIDLAEKEKVQYQFPPISLLKKGGNSKGDSDTYLRETAMKLQNTLQNFGVNVVIKNISCGPTVTRYELQPEQGVKVSKIVGLADDIKLNLAAADIRIEAPIPGKAAVGIEVPNKENAAVMLRDLIDTDAFRSHKSSIAFACGKDIAGQPVIADIAKMPHVLIAGATGSGKSVCINTIIMSIIYRANPEDVKFVMIDPKMVELGVYNGIPHLMIPVVTDPKKAAGALNWAVAEMTKRYQLFAESNVRDLKGYNKKVEKVAASVEENKPEKLPQIIIIVDEMADLMMVAPGEVEGAICRLAQLARAAGIHLVLATQRPSVNVITGLIKANMPSRIALAVTSGVDSRTIIDMNGAEKLLGKGDMLFHPAGKPKPERVQGAFVSDEEVQKVVDFIVEQNGNASYDESIEQQVTTNVSVDASGNPQPADDRDAYFVEAGKLIIDKDKASIGMLQRAFKVGFNRAARIMDQLSEAGVVGPEEGTKPRKVLMSESEFEQYIEEYV